MMQRFVLRPGAKAALTPKECFAWNINFVVTITVPSGTQTFNPGDRVIMYEDTPGDYKLAFIKNEEFIKTFQDPLNVVDSNAGAIRAPSSPLTSSATSPKPIRAVSGNLNADISRCSDSDSDVYSGLRTPTESRQPSTRELDQIYERTTGAPDEGISRDLSYDEERVGRDELAVEPSDFRAKPKKPSIASGKAPPFFSDERTRRR